MEKNNISLESEIGKEEKSNKGKIVAVVIIVAIIAAAVGYYIYRKASVTEIAIGLSDIELTEELKALKSENESLKAKLAGNSLGDALSKAVEHNGVKILATKADAADVNALRTLSDQLKDKLGESVVILGTVIDGKVNLIASATEGAVKKGAMSGNIIKETAPLIGGKGGGRPNMAQAGGNDPSGLENAIERAVQIAISQIQ